MKASTEPLIGWEFTPISCDSSRHRPSVRFIAGVAKSDSPSPSGPGGGHHGLGRADSAFLTGWISIISARFLDTVSSMPLPALSAGNQQPPGITVEARFSGAAKARRASMKVSDQLAGMDGCRSVYSLFLLR